MPERRSDVHTSSYRPAVLEVSRVATKREGARVASALSGALQNHGYALITGHGVSRSLRSTLTRVTRRFFTQSDTEKRLVHWTGEGPWVGYQPIGDQIDPATGDVEQIERFEITRDVVEGAAGNGVWPRRIPAFASTWLTYYAGMEQLTERLMKLAGIALGIGDDGLAAWSVHHSSNLVANYTPAGAKLASGDVLAAHTDFGGFSVLNLSAAKTGLEAGIHGEWRPVPYVPGSLVIQVGDLLSRLSNGLWPAAPHRVRDVNRAAPTDRLSIVYFHQPAPEAVVAPGARAISLSGRPALAPIAAGEYIRMRQQEYAASD